MTDFLPTSADLLPFAPEMALVAAVLAVLLIPVFAARRNILQVAIGAAAGLGVTLLAQIYARTSAVGSPGVYFGGLLVHDPFSWAGKMLLIGFACIVMALWFTDSHDKFIRRQMAADAPDFFAMFLSATLGLCLMVSTMNLLMMFVAMEMASLPVFVLVGFRKKEQLGAQAAMKFFLLGCAATAVMLYGMSLLYGLFGTLDLQQAGVLLGGKEWQHRLGGSAGVVFALGMVGLLVGIGFKAGMAPLHFWCADVFEGAGIDVVTFLSVAPVTAGLSLLMRVLLTLTGAGGATGPLVYLAGAILVLGGITAFCGSLGAFFQTNIKRLLAWSTIAHVGYMLIAMTAIMAPVDCSRSGAASCPTAHATLTSPATEALLVYLFFFLFMNGGAFVAAAAIAQRLTGPAEAGMSLGVDRVTPAGPPVPGTMPGTGEDIRQYAGLSRRAPILAATMLLFLLSLTGLPLTIGFAGRMKLFTTLIGTGSWEGWVGIALIAVNSVIAALSYFRVIREMYLVESDLPRLIEIAPVTVVAMVLVLPNIIFFVAYGWVDHQAQRHAEMIAPPRAVSVEAETPESGGFMEATHLSGGIDGGGPIR